MAFKDWAHTRQEAVEQALAHWLPAVPIAPQRLHEAMRYAVLGAGKRVRPLLVLATGEALGVPRAALAGPACAVELIHAYSLIHDDLPAMDNDDLRRGRPTCHRTYDEATAILAGDALQALAFHVLAHDPAIVAGPELRIRMVDTLAVASGSRGMAGGQALDLAAVGQALSIAELENMHIHKTGALIRASVRLGTLSCARADPAAAEALDHYGKCLGLAFQIKDDILDEEGETTVIGKPQGSDRERNKPTYPRLLGLEGARQAAAALRRQALADLAPLGDAAQPLRWLADYIIMRER
ncbi:MAG: (2E,6E)-farnesyl diphosphate synthase [Gammaproteobacteria bacterium]